MGKRLPTPLSLPQEQDKTPGQVIVLPRQAGALLHYKLESTDCTTRKDSRPF
jgi:hypothetical protein